MSSSVWLSGKMINASIEVGFIEPLSSLRFLKYVNTRKIIVYTSISGVRTMLALGSLLPIPNRFNTGAKRPMKHDSSAKSVIDTNAFVLNFSLYSTAAQIK